MRLLQGLVLTKLDTRLADSDVDDDLPQDPVIVLPVVCSVLHLCAPQIRSPKCSGGNDESANHLQDREMGQLKGLVATVRRFPAFSLPAWHRCEVWPLCWLCVSQFGDCRDKS